MAQGSLYIALECKVMNRATLSSKNQIVIPREAREALGVKAGDQLLVVGAGVYPGGHIAKERKSWD